MLKERKILLLKIAAYPVFFVLCFIVFFPLLLPTEQIKSLVQRELESSAGYRLEAARIGAGLLGGLTFKDVQLSSVSADPKDPKAAKVKLDRLSVGIPFTKIIRGRKAVKFEVEGFDGEVSGVISAKDTLQEVVISIDDVDLSKLAALWEALGVSFTGRLNGSLDLLYDTKDPKKDSGSIKIGFSDLSLAGGKLMGFELPKMQFGKVQGRVEVKDGKADVKEFKGKGRDVEMKGDGFVSMAPRIASSGMALKLKFKPSEDFVQKNQGIQPLLFAVQSAKDRDNFYSFQMSGPLERPYFSMSR